MNESKKTGNNSASLETLTKYIAAQLEERAFCVVFEDALKRFWPGSLMEPAKRNSEIRDFAKSRGWSVTILEGVFGARAIFQRMEPDDIDCEGSP